MKHRLDVLRAEVDGLILKNQAANCKYFFTHLYEVSSFAVLLAKRRGLDPEIAAACGMLHDIYVVINHYTEGHGIKGAEVAQVILEGIGLYSEEEIEVITTAISHHSKKRKIHDGAYDELLKDADVLSHSMHNPEYPLIEKEITRYHNLLAELGCPAAEN